MGRPSSCGCCGTVAPSPVCFNTAPYDQTPWVVQSKTANVSGQFIPNDGNSSIIPSGDKIVLRWEQPGTATTPPTGISSVGDVAVTGIVSPCTTRYETSYPQESRWYPHVSTSGACLSSQYYLCSGFFYEYILTKECYFPSGVKVYGKIEALTSWINAKISLNDGQERIITQFYDYNDGNSTGNGDCCTKKFCDFNYVTTSNSGCYRITVSGSTTNRNLAYEEPFMSGSGAIDFYVGVGGNHASVSERWVCRTWYNDHPCVTCDSCDVGTGSCCTCCDNPAYLGYYTSQIGLTQLDCSDIAVANGCGSNWNYGGGPDSCGDLHACCIPEIFGVAARCEMLTCKACAEAGGTTNYGLTCSGPGPIINCTEAPV